MEDRDKNLPATTGSTRGQLQNSGLRAGSLIDSALSNLTADELAALRRKAHEEALRLEVKQREQNLDYVAGKKSIEDHVDAFAMLDKRGKLTSNKVVTDVKTGAGNMRLESKSGPTCFVATASFEDADHATVKYLRNYRDTVLIRSSRGRAFIAWYWRMGPGLARPVSRYKILRVACRTLLNAVVAGLKLHDRSR